MSPLDIHLLLNLHVSPKPLTPSALVTPTSTAVVIAFDNFRRSGLIHEHVRINDLIYERCKQPWLTAKGEDFVKSLTTLIPAPVPSLRVRPPEPVCMGTIHHPKHGRYYLWTSDEGTMFGISRDDRTTHCGYPSLSALFTAKEL